MNDVKVACWVCRGTVAMVTYASHTYEVTYPSGKMEKIPDSLNTFRGLCDQILNRHSMDTHPDREAAT